MAKTQNKGAKAAKNVARDTRKAANPKSLRGQVRAGVMTRGEAVEQATIRRAGVQAAGRRATTGRAVERGVQERAARVVTRKAEQKAVAGMAQRAASSTLKGRAATAGKAILGRAVAPVTAFTTGYAVGGMANEAFNLSTKVLDYQDFITGKSKQVKDSLTTTIVGGAGSGGRPARRGGARGQAAAQRVATPAKPAVASAANPAPSPVAKAVKPVAKSAAAKKPQVMKESAPAAPARTVTSIAADYFNNPKTQAGEESYAMHKAYLESTKSKSKDIKIGGIAGRTGGKWHLGKRPGKG